MTRRASGSRAAADMPTFAHDVAISAAPYDAMFVSELSIRLSACLATPVVWLDAPIASETPSADWRVGVILHQRLWACDDHTRHDAELLAAHLRKHKGAVVVVRLDDAPVPAWLSSAKVCNLAEAGLEGVISTIVDTVERQGGRISDPIAAEVKAAYRPGWDTPQPFLSQTRAVSTLRRELDSLEHTLEGFVAGERFRRADRVAELHTAPQRVVAQFGETGLSFSWLAGRAGTVADGRLLVIEWDGIVTSQRGIKPGAPARSASPRRETSYRAESIGPDAWCWRADDGNAIPYTTANLAMQWAVAASRANPQDAAEAVAGD